MSQVSLAYAVPTSTGLARRRCSSADGSYNGHSTSTGAPVFGLPPLAKLVQYLLTVRAMARSAGRGSESVFSKTKGRSEAWKTPQRTSESSWHSSEAGSSKRGAEPRTGE